MRAAWRLLVAGEIGAQRLVFGDECGTNTSLSPLHAWSRRGERAYGEAPRSWGSNVTLLASMTRGGMGPCIAVEGATTKAVFEAYVEEALAPSLGAGRAVVMDNLSSHKGQRVRELIEGRGCELLHPPPCSPDLNPIERAFAKPRASLRGAQARTFGALIGAMGRALGGITDRDASGFFRHRGYRAPAQLL